MYDCNVQREKTSCCTVGVRFIHHVTINHRRIHWGVGGPFPHNSRFWDHSTQFKRSKWILGPNNKFESSVKFFQKLHCFAWLKHYLPRISGLTLFNIFPCLPPYLFFLCECVSIHYMYLRHDTILCVKCLKIEVRYIYTYDYKINDFNIKYVLKF